MKARTLGTLALGALWGLLLLGAAGCAGPATETGEKSVRPGINDAYLEPERTPEEWAEIFEGEGREVARCHDAVVAALELRPGMDIADVGAGTGLFLPAFARGVAPGGSVIAVEISPEFVEHMKDRVRREKLEGVQVRLCSERSIDLPDGCVDLVFVCDTYHHFEYPTSTLASIHRALRPGGQLVIIEFNRIPGVSREWILDHVRAGQEVFTEEIEAAGFELEGEILVPGFEENYLLRFRRS